jgi:hypothetical protein
MRAGLGRNYQYRKVRARILEAAQVCAICGGELDFDAPPRSRWAPSVDHVYPISKMDVLDPRTARLMAIDPAGLRAVHVGCNARRGAGRLSTPHISRKW